MNNLYLYYQSLSERDRLAINFCSVFLLALAIWFVLLKPVFSYYQSGQSALREMQALAVWINTHSARFEAMAADTMEDTGDMNVLQLINTYAEQHSVEIRRLEPEQDGSVRSTFSAVPFPAFLRMLEQLEQEAVEVSSLNIDATTAPGFVNVGLVISER